MQAITALRGRILYPASYASRLFLHLTPLHPRAATLRLGSFRTIASLHKELQGVLKVVNHLPQHKKNPRIQLRENRDLRGVGRKTPTFW